MSGLIKLWPSHDIFSLLEDFDSLFDKISVPVKFNFAQFVKNGDTYEFELSVNEKATADNISITLDEKEKTIEIKYSYESEKDKDTEHVSVVETIPDDLDTSTLDANVEGGKLKITAGVIFEPEEPEATVEDKKKVTIKTK